ncbi:uncharacterized protein METZ01_LOCUS306041, partial [marine metagenome]
MFNDFSDTLSLTIAKKILGGFEQHYRNIKKASVEAKRCFEEKEWEKIEKDSMRRLNFYDKQVNAFCKKLSIDLNLKKQSVYGAKATLHQQTHLDKFNSEFWKRTKLAYIELITLHKQPELAETFYNSVFCRLFSRSYYTNQYIFTKPCVSLSYIDMDEPVIESFIVEQGQLKDTFTQILKSFSFNC